MLSVGWNRDFVGPIEITWADVHALDPHQFLNDTVIDFYIRYSNLLTHVNLVSCMLVILVLIIVCCDIGTYTLNRFWIRNGARSYIFSIAFFTQKQNVV